MTFVILLKDIFVRLLKSIYNSKEYRKVIAFYGKNRNPFFKQEFEKWELELTIFTDLSSESKSRDDFRSREGSIVLLSIYIIAYPIDTRFPV